MPLVLLSTVLITLSISNPENTFGITQPGRTALIMDPSSPRSVHKRSTQIFHNTDKCSIQPYDPPTLFEMHGVKRLFVIHLLTTSGHGNSIDPGITSCRTNIFDRQEIFRPSTSQSLIATGDKAAFQLLPTCSHSSSYHKLSGSLSLKSS